MDSDDKFAIAMMIIGCATVLGLTGLLVSCGNNINSATETDAKTAQGVSPAIEHVNGCPLDAMVYDAPKFASPGMPMVKVVDRLSGSSWWLVNMYNEWVVLPVTNVEVTNAG